MWTSRALVRGRGLRVGAGNVGDRLNLGLGRRGRWGGHEGGDVNREQRDADFVGFFGSRVGTLRRLAYALCGDWHTAEDLTQSAFVAVYRRWGQVRLETADAYARRVLVNKFLSHRRRHRRESVVPQVRDEAAAPGDPALRLDLSHV